MDERDIVERLRGHQPAYSAKPEPLCIEAADLISDLREQADNVISQLRLDLTRAREELVRACLDLSTTQAELAEARDGTNINAALYGGTMLELSALRARVVEVGNRTVSELNRCGEFSANSVGGRVHHINLPAATRETLVRALSNLVKEVESE